MGSAGPKPLSLREPPTALAMGIRASAQGTGTCQLRGRLKENGPPPMLDPQRACSSMVEQ